MEKNTHLEVQIKLVLVCVWKLEEPIYLLLLGMGETHQFSHYMLGGEESNALEFGWSGLHFYLRFNRRAPVQDNTIIIIMVNSGNMSSLWAGNLGNRSSLWAGKMSMVMSVRRKLLYVCLHGEKAIWKWLTVDQIVGLECSKIDEWWFRLWLFWWHWNLVRRWFGGVGGMEGDYNFKNTSYTSLQIC